jgi:hypothetical protein
LSDLTEQTSGQSLDLPPTLRAERDASPVPKRPWYRTIGPAYLTIFVWAPFFDSLWVRDLPRAGLPGLAGTAVVASIICYVFFYYPTAIWGYRTGRGLGVVAASTFGTAGSEWITGVGIGAAQLVWYAVAIDYGVDSTLRGLVAWGLVPANVLGRWELGPLSLRGFLFVHTAAFWIFITGSASLLRLVGIIAALMRIYAPVALLLLTASALWVVPNLGGYAVENAVEVAGSSGLLDGGGRRYSILPLFTGFFALLGLMSVDWGAASLRRRDVTVGGLMGIVLAGSWTAIMALLVVAGAVGRLGAADPDWTATDAGPPLLSFRWGVLHGIGGYPAGGILILFGLAALAPACYSTWLFSRRFAARWSKIRRTYWTWIGGAIALLLIATSWSSRLEAIDYVMGLVFAPALGALVGDFLDQRGGWAGVRPDVNPPGMIAWLAGLAIRPVGELMASRSPGFAAEFLSSPIVGFATAVLVYVMLTRIGLGRTPIPLGTVGDPDLQVGTVAAEVPAVSNVAVGPAGSEPPPSETCRDGQP